MSGKSKRLGVRTSNRPRRNRERFTEEYRANACNRIPGRVLQGFYRLDISQREIQNLAEDWEDMHKIHGGRA